MITNHFPKPTRETKKKALELAIEECLINGITTFHDARTGGEDTIDIYKEFLKEKKLKIRLYVILNGENEELMKEWYAKGPEIGLGNNFITIRSAKLEADGALGSRGAWLLEPYSDRPGHNRTRNSFNGFCLQSV